MTKEEFKLLSPEAQEKFIEDGGVLEISQSVESVAIVPELTVENKQAEIIGSVAETAGVAVHNIDSPSVEVSGSSTSQPANALGGDVNETISGSKRHIDTPRNSSDTKVGALRSSKLEVYGESHFDGIDIQDPVELLYLLDENIINGFVKLHPWQIQFMIDFATGGLDDKEPFQAVVRAANGSGKDKYIIAICVVWLGMRWKKSISVVTSASGVQLDNQTCRYIKSYCEAANRKFQTTVWDVKYRSYSITFEDGAKSEVFCYATDEAGKAEGYHPTEFGAKMGIFVSEDKSVTDEINVALNKCTGYTHRAHVSTPGLPLGHFFEMCTTAVDRKGIKSVFDVNPEDWIEYHVTAYDCSHISPAYIKQMKRDLPGGELGAAFKSQVLAEFGTTDEMTVIPYIYIWKCVKHLPTEGWIQEPYNKAGLDLSDGGDETVLTVRNGNRHLHTVPFRFDNTEDTVAYLNEKFKEYKLTHRDATINADCGGLGKPILDRMKRQGWTNIRYIDNRAKALYPKTYKNRAAELYFLLAKLIERHEIIIQLDDRLVKQLATRYYKINTDGIHQLLSKMEQKSRGYPSPDRADSFTLCFWDYKSVRKEFKPESSPIVIPEEDKKLVTDFTLKGSALAKKPQFIVNNGQKNFSYLEEQIREYNQQIVRNN